MSEKMKGIQTATVEPEPRKLPVVPLGIGAVVVAAGAFALWGPGSVDAGPWASTASVAEPSPCRVTLGKGAVPDVDAVDCHPSEYFARGLLPPEALMVPTATASMYRSSKDGEWLAIRYRGVGDEGADAEALLAALAPKGEVDRGTAESLALPDGWPVGEAWRPSWDLPEGSGNLTWVQSPKGDVSCSEDPVQGAFVFRAGDELVAARWKGTADCPLWKQLQRRNRTPWKRPGFGGFGGGL